MHIRELIVAVVSLIALHSAGQFVPAAARYDGLISETVFTYDANGNMISDGRKGLEMNWNLLNLADSAAMHGSSLTYAYLPFGTKTDSPGLAVSEINRWRYAAKEEQRFSWTSASQTTTLDLSLLDFGARMYDPFTARWTAVDPMAGKYQAFSPYDYCAGNSVNLVDGHGFFPVKAAKTTCKLVKKTYKAVRASEKVRAGVMLAEEAYSLIDDASTIIDPETSFAQKAFAAFDLATGLGDEAKLGLKTLAHVETKLFTTSYEALSRRMKKLTGNVTPEGKHAHHMLPWIFRRDFWDAGIDISDPQYGIWLDAHLHLTRSSDYEKAWRDYLKDKHTADEIVNKMKELMREIYEIEL